MKKKQVGTTELKATVNDKLFILSITRENSKKSMTNCSFYSCMIFDSEMKPFKRFTLIYNRLEQLYWAWTGDCIGEEDRNLREEIAQQFNKGELSFMTA